MSKLTDFQVKQYQYGSIREGGEVIQFCAKNPQWPRVSDKETIERIVIAAGMKTRRYVSERDGEYGDPRMFIIDTFRYIWQPIAQWEHTYLYTTLDEFKTEEFQQSSIREEINQVLKTVDNAAELKKQQNMEQSMRNNPSFRAQAQAQGGGQGQGGGYNGQGGGQGGQGGGQNMQNYWAQEQEEPTYDLKVDGDPYEHDHKPCSCKHCNRGNKARCHLCGNELTDADYRQIKENEQRDEQRKKDEEAKIQKEKEKVEKEKRLRKEQQKKQEELKNRGSKK